MVFDGRYCSALRTVGDMAAVVPLEAVTESEPEDVLVVLSSGGPTEQWIAWKIGSLAA